MRKYEQIVYAELVRTRKVLGGSKVPEMDVNECPVPDTVQNSVYRGVSSQNSLYASPNSSGSVHTPLDHVRPFGTTKGR